MMDMMTIILVFLLKTFSGSTQIITLDSEPAGPRLAHPAARQGGGDGHHHQEGDPGRGRPVAPVNNGKVDPSVKRDGENGYYIPPLVDILEQIANRERRVAELTGQKFDSELMVVADQTTPYRLLTEVLYSCGQAGYSNYRLVVLSTSD